MVQDVQLELHVVAIGQQAFDAAVIVVAHNHRGHTLGGVVKAVLLRHDDAVGPRRVVHPRDGAAFEQHAVDPVAHLSGGQPVGILRAAAPTPAECAAPAVAALGIVHRFHQVVRTALLRRLEADRNHGLLAGQHDLAADLILRRRDPGVHLLPGRSQVRRTEATAAPPWAGIGARLH